MKPLNLEEVITAMEGVCDRVAPQGNVLQICTDSRAVRSGDLFIAIRGDRFDGHDYVGKAIAAGAVAAVVRSDFELSRTPSAPPIPAGSLIRVDDTIVALGRLGRYYRRSVIGGSMTVVAVTGSNGKTTTKSMIAHVLAGRWQGKASIKSYNNNIGVPLTLLSAEPPESFLVCEVGMNAPGEISGLARLIEPDVAVVTCVAEAHLEKFGTIDKIAEEKLSILSHLKADGCAVVHVDSEPVRRLLQKDRRFKNVKAVTFGAWEEADLRLTDVQTVSLPAPDGETPTTGLEFTVNGRFRYQLNVPGRHNAMNALATIGVARRFGMDHAEIAERLATFQLPRMRLECERVGRLTLINDAYNANPASLAAGVDVLRELPVEGRRVVIVGDMRELGEASESLHVRAAEHIAHCGVDLVVAVGSHARVVARTVASASNGAVETHAYATTDLARRRIVSHLEPTDTILVKGSRAMGLERLVETIRDWASLVVSGSPTATRGSNKRRAAG